MGYIHIPNLAPTRDLLGAYRKGLIDWPTYESRFIDLMRERKVEVCTPREVVINGCMLCSERQPHHCHRRLVGEYLSRHWGGVEIKHLS